MSKNYLVILLFLLNGAALVGQSSKNAFRNLPSSEKKWVLAHPFIALKAFNCALRSRIVTDSLEKTKQLIDGNGGQLDAFRHAYWMALLTLHISPKKSIRLGKVHEQGNYSEWKKGIQEDGFRADSMMCEMDLKNNLVGVELGKSFRKDTSKIKLSLTEQVLAAVKSGKLTIIKKNNLGQCLDESGRIIDLKLYEKQWFIPKIIVRSDYIQPQN